MTTETHDEDLILSPAPKMKNHKVPFYFDSHANNTSKGLPSGSIPSGKNPTCQHHNKLVRISLQSRFRVGQALLKHEQNVKTLLLDIKMMVFPLQLTVPYAAPVQLSQCVNPDQLKTERSENNLRLCGENWLNQLKVLFPDRDDEGACSIPALDTGSPILSIKDRRNGIGFSNLPRLVADKRLLLLHLICLFLVFRLKCCNGFFLKLTGLMCDGRAIASPLFRRLAGRGAFFLSWFRWILRLVAFMIRGFTLHDSSSCSRDDSLDQCGRPCDPLSCLVFFSSVASLLPIYIGEGDSDSEWMLISHVL